ncbi:MAG: 50S ribosomal protein P1 [Candidatus ainarchaeum sp.]|nr:50S ribosomal protein P1 [Candidatus ainarchaeum sp.]
MEYVYTALLLHSLGKKVDEQGIAAIITAAGGTPDAAKAKALVASLEGVDIEKAIKSAAMPVAAAPAAAAPAAGEAKKEEKSKEEEKKSEEEAAAGLASLFG